MLSYAGVRCQGVIVLGCLCLVKALHFCAVYAGLSQHLPYVCTHALMAL